MKTAADLSHMQTPSLLRALRVVGRHQRGVSLILSETLGRASVSRECTTYVVPAWVLGGSHEQHSTVTVGQLRDELVKRMALKRR